jgi:UDP-N-acetylmuramoyl-L-alanine---L-glutamate ligase
MVELIRTLFTGKKIAILGFGREGKSTYKFLRQCMPTQSLHILDAKAKLDSDKELASDPYAELSSGEDIYFRLNDFDLIMKAPGVPGRVFPQGLDAGKIHSQTSLFLQYYARQVIGVTGTKGKSTTASLIRHIISNAGFHSILLGNIGLPPFEGIPDISPETIIVMELSSHQLQYLVRSPHIGILLNIFQEHLDHYSSYEEYQQAKLNISHYQEKDDYLIYCADNQAISSHMAKESGIVHILLPYSARDPFKQGICLVDDKVILKIGEEQHFLFDAKQSRNLPGEHNLLNIMAASAACFISGVNVQKIREGISSFKGLEHRIEFVGEVEGILFYNDSIATIPEATIEAIRTLENVDTLILGGYDRGIDYSMLYPFVLKSAIRNIIFIGNAGARMRREMEQENKVNPNLFTAGDYDEVVRIAKKVTKKGKICLLSPAASSYDMFLNFEHRGNIYKKNVRG